MKKLFWIVGIMFLLIWNKSAQANFDSGSNGTLGNYTATVSKTIQLPPDGKLNYQSVHVYPNATITFQKNAANTPVYMLATDDVLIEGTINVNGTNATTTDIGKGGPGGLDGGYGGGHSTDGGKGLGPGGGNPARTGTSGFGGGGGGGFGASGSNGYAGSNPGTGGSTYGNAKLLPLIGGSGGGGGSGDSSSYGTPGGGGGGAIVIASSKSITVTGSITANGGNGGASSGGAYGGGAGGSGGAVKLIADGVSGNGQITAIRGVGYDRAGNGGAGRIRLEATTNNRTATTDPAYSYGLPSSIFVSAQPSLSITSIGGTTPTNPTGNYNQPDILLSSGSSVTVNISATNIPLTTTVHAWVIPQYGNATSYTANGLSGTDQASTTTANVTLSSTYSNIVTADATFTIEGMYFNGEKIDKVRVATTMGGKSETVYITESGKEIKSELIASLIK